VPRVEFAGVGKRFGGTRALDGVSLVLENGECHALVGENGAGKSTLGRILAGIHAPDEGALRLDGKPVRFRSPADARAAGVAMVHQELSFCPELSVAENLALGAWPRRGPGRLFVDRRAMRQLARRRLEEIGAALDVDAPLASLSTAQEQLVQVAAAVGTGAGLLVFDEPTSALTPAEAERLFALIGRLRSRGATILYVSHRLPEVEALADRISVLRDGRLVATLGRAQATRAGLVRRLSGREAEAAAPSPVAAAVPGASTAQPSEPVLRVEVLSSPGRFQDVSFAVGTGEIVGLAGLVGAGRSELARALFGLDGAARGRVLVGGAPLRLGSTRAAIAAGLALLPEDRKRQGLVLGLGARPNWSLPILGRLPRWGGRALSALRLLDRRAERRAAGEALAAVGARPASLDLPVASLSGGNQQKVVLARWLSTGARVLLVDEPTRGVDVGAKVAIHALLREKAREGTGILLVSSELEELLALSDRLLVMRAGRLAGEAPRAAASQESLLRMMAGV
jgi:ABC-type sugar transport system ATPase subunit